MYLSVLTYTRVMEAVSQHNFSKKPVHISDIVLDKESIQIGQYYFKKVDLEVDLRAATRAYISGYLYSSYVNLLDIYYANN